ncbi:hypothetical protein MESS4_430149 [Mesorhizobium sp. STM 4661]|nr:hypothetical protein MESS4_430149 [Mesorhizobium sp. STM 4661]
MSGIHEGGEADLRLRGGGAVVADHLAGPVACRPGNSVVVARAGALFSNAGRPQWQAFSLS